MNRRGFICLLAGAAGGALIPWRAPNEPAIFLPPAGGWAARSVRELWLDYANRIRPAGVLATASIDPALDTPWVVDELLGRAEIRLRVAASVPPSVERHMRSALLQEPTTFRPWSTLGDFAPWEFPPDSSYFVERSDDVRRIHSLSRII